MRLMAERDTFTHLIDIILPAYMRGRGKAGKRGEEKSGRDVDEEGCESASLRLSIPAPFRCKCPQWLLAGSLTPYSRPNSQIPCSQVSDEERQEDRADWEKKSLSIPSSPHRWGCSFRAIGSIVVPIKTSPGSPELSDLGVI